MTRLIIHTDGGARNNPGPAGIGVVAFLEKEGAEKEQVFALGKAIGSATNNEAEYQAFLASLEWLLTQNTPSWSEIVWRLDSKLVVEQLNKHWKIKEPRMQVFAQAAWQQLKQLSLPYRIEHVLREQNAAADALYNAALDEAGF